MATGQICKVIKDKNFTTMGNYHLRDKKLSLKAKGLLSVVLSLPDDWDYSIAGLVAIVKEKETVVRSCLNELRKYGYHEIRRELPSKENGGRFQYVYMFYEKSQVLDHKTQNTICEKQDVEFLDVEFLDVEFLDVENQGQINTNILSKEKVSKEKEIVSKETRQKQKKQKEEDFTFEGDTATPLPEGKGKSVSKEVFEQEFAELWKLYPRKEGKADGLKAYVKVRRKGVKKEQILEGLKRYLRKLMNEKTERRFIIKGGNWFKGERWEDEVEVVVEETPKKEKDNVLDLLKKLG